jgi:transaldolase
MAIWLDSADPSDARICAELRFVSGITTNPTLLASVDRPPLTVIEELLKVFPGPVCYQITAADAVEAEQEARNAAGLSPGRVVIKIPATLANIALGARLAPQVPWALTATFSAAQVALACEAGSRYVIPYVDRMTRLGGNGLEVTSQMAEICRRSGKGVEVLAASIKSPDQAMRALLAGAHHISAPLLVIREMAEHQLSASAISEFARPPAAPSRQR